MHKKEEEVSALINKSKTKLIMIDRTFAPT